MIRTPCRSSSLRRVTFTALYQQTIYTSHTLPSFTYFALMVVRRRTSGSDLIPAVTETDVLVYIKSDHSISLLPRSVVESMLATSDDRDVANRLQDQPPSNIVGDEIKVSRNPLARQQKIDVPRSPPEHKGDAEQKDYFSSCDSSKSSCDYSSVVVFDRISKNMSWRRLLGSIRVIVVLENAPSFLV